MSLAPAKPLAAVGSPLTARPVAASTRKARRSQRVALRIPVIAYSDASRSQPHPKFEETTLVVRVSAHGGLLESSGPLRVGDRFMLRHVNRDEKAECRAVFVQNGTFGRKLAGFEFTGGPLNFWGVSFPPPDARPGVRARP